MKPIASSTIPHQLSEEGRGLVGLLHLRIHLRIQLLVLCLTLGHVGFHVGVRLFQRDNLVLQLALLRLQGSGAAGDLLIDQPGLHHTSHVTGVTD